MVATALTLAAAGPAGAKGVDADLLLAGGTIYSGDDDRGTVGDVAVRGADVIARSAFAHSTEEE